MTIYYTKRLTLVKTTVHCTLLPVSTSPPKFGFDRSMYDYFRGCDGWTNRSQLILYIAGNDSIQERFDSNSLMTIKLR